MMKKIILLASLALGLASALVHAETAVILTTVPESYTGSWTVYAAYKVGAEVWVEIPTGWMTPTKTMASEEMDYGCPAIMVTYVIDQHTVSQVPNSSANCIYSLAGATTRDYDSTLGDGWICHNFFYWCYVQDYPWVYVWKYHKWIYMSSTGPATYGDLQANAWWIWADDRGWYWTIPELTLWQWSCKDNGWIIP